MLTRPTVYIALLLLLTGIGYNAEATLPDSRQYVVHLTQDSPMMDIEKSEMHGSVLLMVSPDAANIQFTATLNNSNSPCNLSLHTYTESGQDRKLATLKPNAFKVERAGETGSRMHLSGSISDEDLSGQSKAGTLEDLCRLLQENKIYFKARIAPVSGLQFDRDSS